MSDSVDVERLRELIDEWEVIYREGVKWESEWQRGMAEGARSAAVELERVIERAEDGEPRDGESYDKTGGIRPVPPGVANTPEEDDD